MRKNRADPTLDTAAQQARVRARGRCVSAMQWPKALLPDLVGGTLLLGVRRDVVVEERLGRQHHVRALVRRRARWLPRKGHRDVNEHGQRVGWRGHVRTMIEAMAYDREGGPN